MSSPPRHKSGFEGELGCRRRRRLKRRRPRPDSLALGLSELTLRALEHAGFTVPSPVQAQLIPPAMAGRDCLGNAPTGHGQDGRVPAPDHREDRRARAAAAGPDPGPDPRAGPPDRPRVREALRSAGASAPWRSSAASRCSQQTAAGSRLPDRGRHARPADGPDGPAARSGSTRSRSSCSTRPTRCSTSGSARPSRRSWRPCPTPAADLPALGHHAPRGPRPDPTLPRSTRSTSASSTRTRTRRSRRSGSRT